MRGRDQTSLMTLLQEEIHHYLCCARICMRKCEHWNLYFGKYYITETLTSMQYIPQGVHYVTHPNTQANKHTL